MKIDDPIRYLGLHHLGLITADLNATIRFYRDLLGLPLSIAVGGEVRHYMFDLSETEKIAFFAYDGAELPEKRPAGYFGPGGRAFDHVALQLATLDDLYVLRARLMTAGVEVTSPQDHGLFVSIYFHDPNHVPLEAAVNTVRQLKPILVDSHPSPAAREGAAPRLSAWSLNETFVERLPAVPGNGAELRELGLAQGQIAELSTGDRT